jgi:hypothetical protein
MVKIYEVLEGNSKPSEGLKVRDTSNFHANPIPATGYLLVTYLGTLHIDVMIKESCYVLIPLLWIEVGRWSIANFPCEWVLKA